MRDPALYFLRKEIRLDIFGLIAYAFIGFFYPSQLWAMYKSKKVDGVSPTALWMLDTGNALMFVSTYFYSKYALYWVASIVFTVLTSMMLVMYYKYRKG